MNRQNPGIGWCDYTWNPAVGCKGDCDYCYARGLAKQFKHCEKCATFEPHTHPERLNQPYTLRKPAKIFIDSMWDFRRGGIKRAYKQKILDVIRDNPQHIFQVLTKRPPGYEGYDFPENLWLGVTVTGYDDIGRIHWLKGIDGNNIKFSSFEPLLDTMLPEMLKGVYDMPQVIKRVLKPLDWLIIGAQTGPNAVKPERAWVEEILEVYDGPVFMKDNLLKVLPELKPRREFP